eukprot:CAMPEP_0114522078 /NCGR_PEP_ID=MMETSP0109-20121206/20551_1 /TAXON_ID=29199 /ORGANISM="Chlorarachnion reptans, Strain CCCM449" /LENGTH=168 /DNA_ID=CAMNT_0001703273 /DNA_START=282 /DNA_END=788 /DNA_ORIENTATION=-
MGKLPLPVVCLFAQMGSLCYFKGGIKGISWTNSLRSRLKKTTIDDEVSDCSEEVSVSFRIVLATPPREGITNNDSNYDHPPFSINSSTFLLSSSQSLAASLDNNFMAILTSPEAFFIAARFSSSSTKPNIASFARISGVMSICEPSTASSDEARDICAFPAAFTLLGQ